MKKRDFWPAFKGLALTTFLSSSLVVYALLVGANINPRTIGSSILMSMFVSICIYAEKNQDYFKKLEPNKLVRFVILLAFAVPMSGGAMTFVWMT